MAVPHLRINATKWAWGVHAPP